MQYKETRGDNVVVAAPSGVDLESIVSVAWCVKVQSDLSLHNPNDN